jgi:hypothetical protein
MRDMMQAHAFACDHRRGEADQRSVIIRHFLGQAVIAAPTRAARH